MADDDLLREVFGQGVGGKKDAAPSAPTPVEPAANVRETFREPVRARESTFASKAMQLPAGFNIGLSEALGAPVDLVNLALSKVGVPVSEEPFLGSKSIARGMRAVGVRPEAYEPVGRTEEVLRAFGRGAGQAAGFQTGAAGLTRAGLGAVAPRTEEAIQKVFGAAKPTLPSTAANIVMGGAGQVGAETAEQMVPERWKPLAGMAGGVAGGMAAGLPIAAAGRAIPAMVDLAKSYAAPFTEAGQRRVAAEKLGATVPSVQAAKDILESEPREIIPGSKPTTPEIVASPEMGQLMEERQRLDPTKFAQRRAEQAGAREQAFSEIQPEGAPAAVSRFLREQFNELDAREQRNVERATQAARSAAENIGGTRPPEETGAAMRQRLQDAKGAAREERSKLYEAVDPEGKIQIVTSPIREAADQIQQSIGPLAKPLSGEIEGIFSATRQLGDTTRFSDLVDLDKRINAEMREEMKRAGETPHWGLLANLKRNVADAINNAVENQAANEAREISAGVRSPEQTIQARLEQWRDQFYRGKEGAVEPAPQMPSGITQQDVDALRAAKQAHGQYAETFKEGPVSEALASRGFQGQYKILDASVGDKFFRPGPKGFEAAQAYLRAAGDDAASIGLISDYAAASMLRKARNADGTINPAKFEEWRKSHQDALRAIPGLSERFSTAAAASTAAEEASRRARDSIDNFQRGSVAKVMGLEAPEDVTRSVGNIFSERDAVGKMRELVRATSSNPDAQNGLRKAVLDYITNRFTSTTEEGFSGINRMRSAEFQKFVRDNRATLGQVLDSRQVAALQAVADDLHRSNRVISGALTPGRSATAQLTPDQQKTRSILAAVSEKLLSGGAPAAAAFSATQSLPFATAAAIAGMAADQVVGSLRQAGIDKIDKLITEAVLNPDVALQLLKSLPQKQGIKADKRLIDDITRLGILGELQGRSAENGSGDNYTGPRMLTIPALNRSERQARATGGAVNLTALANAARKAVTKSTEELLETPDEHVVKALEIANRHI